jgi:EAL domain-containing protein (putative c-di-GMP-specific phosphodiesterase class I)
VYFQHLHERARVRLALENALRNALERDEIVLHYQPQVNLQTGAMVGVEALLRWQHPELGLILPARFIPLAEKTGLIVPIGTWVLRTACAQAAAWQRAGMGNLRVAVNLSASQFAQPDFACVIARALEESGLYLKAVAERAAQDHIGIDARATRPKCCRAAACQRVAGKAR